jgi:hypothetical protein
MPALCATAFDNELYPLQGDLRDEELLDKLFAEEEFEL